jgi:hypothetical protein
MIEEIVIHLPSILLGDEADEQHAQSLELHYTFNTIVGFFLNRWFIVGIHACKAHSIVFIFIYCTTYGFWVLGSFRH